MTAEDYKNGQVLLIDKPLNWTSFQVVNKLRWEIRQQFNIKKIKVGHAGTLDPLATGLLVICTGKQTKEIHIYQGQVKQYTGTFVLGATTPSYDLETEIDKTFPTTHITEALLHATTNEFVGDIQQKPPIFSAIKKDGKRLYEIARKGETVEIQPRQVSVLEFEITSVNLPEVTFRIVCSKGTYIRSLAHDFGVALNSGAHLSSLRRTKIGDFNVDKALTVEKFIETLKSEAN
ncbi:tRNA pseudouridine(55) synthase TruB [uncultured Polaribacter sp.]|uniref:tRNA pseudouridine(55) synthase TruB n=1 Tax=uncultured Polaribacter sp. TaxID=174711 RepID=UPI002634CB3E|nr:tRNA pseudouridine(55) synthase TruB [uncultured Polaribacter sp.]